MLNERMYGGEMMENEVVNTKRFLIECFDFLFVAFVEMDGKKYKKRIALFISVGRERERESEKNGRFQAFA